MNTPLDATQTSVLKALCDTYVPAISVADDPTGFWARTASDMGVPRIIASFLENEAPPPLAAGALGVLTALDAAGFVGASQDRRERIVRQLAASSPEIARVLLFFEKQTLLLQYGLPETPPGNPQEITYGTPDEPNPNWQVLGYPGPATAPPDKPKAIRTVIPDGDSLELEADVCIVGSGAGGGVIAARLAARGLRVVVLESGGQYNASDFHQLELWSYKHLWYRGGATLTDDGNVNLLAGATLGGGTEINWMNCIRTPDLIRHDWVRRFGLEGVDTPTFEHHIDFVEQRLMVNSETALWNDQNLRMREGCLELGYLTRRTRINWNPETFNSLLAGYTGIGDQTGAKQTVRRTFLRDAYHDGARILVNTRADRILHHAGQAIGLEATYADTQGRRAKVTVHAPQVVVACGSLESPALLLRTGIGGPAVGKYLHVQPGGAVYGVYDKLQRGWWGSPMTANCEEFVDLGDGYGFYMEIPAFAPGFYASVIPWASGRKHKELMTKVPNISTFIWFLRDKSHGRVTLDENGNAKIVYSLDDPIDQRNFRKATAEAIRIHHAAGARQILFAMSDGTVTWDRHGGRDLESFIRRIEKQPLLGGAQPIISAHQLSTCRLGNDPATSVANIHGELRDVKGVWIGDASGCPTALGANPMITIMALADRTAANILARLGARDAAYAPQPRRDSGYVPGAEYTLARSDGSPAAGRGGWSRPTEAMLRGMFGLMTMPWRMASAIGEQILDPSRSARGAAQPPPSSGPVETGSRAGRDPSVRAGTGCCGERDASEA